jgi:hypothetical protein
MQKRLQTLQQIQSENRQRIGGAEGALTNAQNKNKQEKLHARLSQFMREMSSTTRGEEVSHIAETEVGVASGKAISSNFSSN